MNVWGEIVCMVYINIYSKENAKLPNFEQKIRHCFMIVKTYNDVSLIMLTNPCYKTNAIE